jgi:cytochrome P450
MSQNVDAVADPSVATATTTKVRFNPFDKGFRNNPYPTYKTLRENDPVHRIFGAWVLTKYDDVLLVLKDRRFNVSLIPNVVKRQAEIMGKSFHGIEGFVKKAIVFTEDPDHARLRKLVHPAFTSKVVQAERGMIEGLVEKCLQKAFDKKEIDIIHDFADPVSLGVLCHRLNLPESMHSTVKEWMHDIRYLLDPGLMKNEDYIRVENVVQTFKGYLAELIDERRKNPGDDFMSQLIVSSQGSDQLTDDEILLLCIMTFVAGGETTRHLIGNAVFELLSHPSELTRLQQAPELISSAIDEVLRYNTPLQQTKRYATEDVEIEGKTIKEGDQLLLCLSAANRDPSRFKNPDVFDITRKNNKHLSFGYGMHNCLGGFLTTLEAQLACGQLFQRADITLKNDEPEWLIDGVILRGLKHLPVTIIKKPV